MAMAILAVPCPKALTSLAVHIPGIVHYPATQVFGGNVQEGVLGEGGEPQYTQSPLLAGASTSQ